MKIKILTLDTPNKNNRIYPKLVMEKTIKDIQNDIKSSRFFIVKNIPESETINLIDICGVVKDISIDKNEVFSDVEFFDNDIGKLLKDGIDSGKLFVRPSGIGSFIKKEDGMLEISNDYQMTSIFVTDKPA